MRVAAGRSSRKDGEKKDDTTWRTVEIWTPATVSWLAAKPLPKGA